ncbi:MAG: dethiobiotin synthase [Campylobacter sp.]|nr:dethiobiotin synthase [Campylobacter sp.]
MKKFFITGTDTDIGKTFITASLLGAFLEFCDTKAIKPIQTGCEVTTNKLIAPDVLEYQKVNMANSFEPRYMFKFPASPHFAAMLENSRISLKEIQNYINSFKSEILLVEGAGGLFVPLNENESFLDLLKSKEFEIILVCKNTLGAINHTLLNVEMLKSLDIKIAALVINQTIKDDKICTSNLEFLRTKLNGIDIISVPKFKEFGNKFASEYFMDFAKNFVI